MRAVRTVDVCARSGCVYPPACSSALCVSLDGSRCCSHQMAPHRAVQFAHAGIAAVFSEDLHHESTTFVSKIAR
jgi:hypothetical protein